MAALIVLKKFETELIPSHRQVSIPSLADLVSTSRELLTFGSKATSPGGRRPTNTTTEVHEPLATNPASSVYKCGLSDEDVNIPRVGDTESLDLLSMFYRTRVGLEAKDRVSRVPMVRAAC